MAENKKPLSHRKLSFNRVVEKLSAGEYYGRICQLDYSNMGIRLFDESKFSQQLGVNFMFLREIGLVREKEFSGWNLYVAPTVQELMNSRTLIEEEIKRSYKAWKEWKDSRLRSKG